MNRLYTLLFKNHQNGNTIFNAEYNKNSNYKIFHYLLNTFFDVFIINFLGAF